MAVLPKMPVVLPFLIVAIVASTFASPSTASRPPTAVEAAPAKPLVENLPASPAAQDFVRARCDQCSGGQPEDSRICYELLLPYATSINSSYNRATTAGVTVMISKLTAFATTSPPPPGKCIQVVNGAISGAKEFLPKLRSLDTIGDDKVNPILVDMSNWIMDAHGNFTDNCRDASAGRVSAAARDAFSTAYGLVISARPYWDNSLPSPDGSGP